MPNLSWTLHPSFSSTAQRDESGKIMNMKKALGIDLYAFLPGSSFSCCLHALNNDFPFTIRGACNIIDISYLPMPAHLLSIRSLPPYPYEPISYPSLVSSHVVIFSTGIILNFIPIYVYLLFIFPSYKRHGAKALGIKSGQIRSNEGENFS
jgi:hypothetical protein